MTTPTRLDAGILSSTRVGGLGVRALVVLTCLLGFASYAAVLLAVSLRALGASGAVQPGLLAAIGLISLISALLIMLVVYAVVTRQVVHPLQRLDAGARALLSDTGNKDDIPYGGAHELLALGQTLRVVARILAADKYALRSQVAQLQEARDQIVRAEHLAAVGRVAAGIAHEIGNPLTSILGMVQVLQSAEFDSIERNDFLRRIERETERIHRIVSDLLSYARSGQFAQVESEDVDVKALLLEVVALTQTSQTPIELRLPSELHAPSLSIIRGHRDALQQVLLNLLKNAQFAATNNPHREPRVQVLCDVSTSHVTISVHDSGAGISAEDLPKLFEPFFTTKPLGQGTGLGLSICQSLTLSMGGTVAAHNLATGGACFVVTLGTALSQPQPQPQAKA